METSKTEVLQLPCATKFEFFDFFLQLDLKITGKLLGQSYESEEHKRQTAEEE